MTRMTIGSCSDFHHQVLEHITTATPAALHIESQAASYQSASDTLASIVNRQRAFISTKTLSEADDIRDHAIGTINSVVNAYATSPVEEHREAALLLQPQLSAYKGIARHEYSKQTAEVRGMLGVLDAEDNAPAVTALGLDGEVEALRTANATFEAKFLDKASEMSVRMTQNEVKSEDAIAEANALYQAIVQVVNAYAIVQPTETINTFIDRVNGLVGVYSRIAGGNASGGLSPSDDSSDSEQPGGGTTPGGGSTGDGSDDGEL